MKLSQIIAIFRKETLDSLRDKRSVFISFVLPLFLFPVFVLLLSSVENKKSYVVSHQGLDASVVEYLNQDQQLMLVDSNYDEAKLKQHKIDAHLTLYDKVELKAIEISFNNTTRQSVEAFEYLKAKFTAYRLEKSMIESSTGDDFVVVYMPLYDIKSGTSTFMLFSILPMLLLIIAVTSPIAVAADLVAGEKERGTLELLLTTGARGSEVVCGKYLTVLLFGFLGTIAFLGGLIISTKISLQEFGMSKFSLTPTQGALLLLSLFVLTLVSAGIELFISTLAKSTKEAQLYIIPLSILFVSANSFSEKVYFFTGQNAELATHFIPVFNIAHFIRQIIMAETEMMQIITMVTTNLLLVALLLVVTVASLRSEKIIYRS